MILYYTTRAKQDVEEAFLWYKKQQKGLGNDFLDCMEKTLNDMMDFPEIYPVCYKKFRRALLHKFPFSVFYTIEHYKIVIHAIFNQYQSSLKQP